MKSQGGIEEGAGRCRGVLKPDQTNDFSSRLKDFQRRDNQIRLRGLAGGGHSLLQHLSLIRMVLYFRWYQNRIRCKIKCYMTIHCCAICHSLGWFQILEGGIIYQKALDSQAPLFVVKNILIIFIYYCSIAEDFASLRTL